MDPELVRQQEEAEEAQRKEDMNWNPWRVQTPYRPGPRQAQLMRPRPKDAQEEASKHTMQQGLDTPITGRKVEIVVMDDPTPSLDYSPEEVKAQAEEGNDPVHRPNHYARFKIEPIHFIAENQLPFMAGNVVKYVCRHDAKNGVEDLKKARRYLDMMIKKAEGDAEWSA